LILNIIKFFKGGITITEAKSLSILELLDIDDYMRDYAKQERAAFDKAKRG